MANLVTKWLLMRNRNYITWEILLISLEWIQEDLIRLDLFADLLYIQSLSNIMT